MPVRIRLKRVGAKGQPYYRIVVADGRAPRDGRIIEAIGHYNPVPEQPDVGLNEERVMLWLERGALPSDTVLSLLTRQGVMERFYQKWPKRRPEQPAQRAPAAGAQAQPAPAQEARTDESEPEPSQGESETEPQESQPVPDEASENA